MFRCIIYILRWTTGRVGGAACDFYFAGLWWAGWPDFDAWAVFRVIPNTIAPRPRIYTRHLAVLLYCAHRHVTRHLKVHYSRLYIQRDECRVRPFCREDFQPTIWGAQKLYWDYINVLLLILGIIFSSCTCTLISDLHTHKRGNECHHNRRVWCHLIKRRREGPVIKCVFVLWSSTLYSPCYYYLCRPLKEKHLRNQPVAQRSVHGKGVPKITRRRSCQSIRFLFWGGNNFLTFRLSPLRRKNIIKTNNSGGFLFDFSSICRFETRKSFGTHPRVAMLRQADAGPMAPHSQQPGALQSYWPSFEFRQVWKKEISTSSSPPDDQTLSLFFFLFCLLERDGFWRLVLFLPTSFCLETRRTLLLLNCCCCHVAHFTRPPPIFTSSDEWEKLSESQ